MIIAGVAREDAEGGNPRRIAKCTMRRAFRRESAHPGAARDHGLQEFPYLVTVHESRVKSVQRTLGRELTSWMLRSFTPTRATSWSFHGLMESMEGPLKQPPNGRVSSGRPPDRPKTSPPDCPRAARAVAATRGNCRPGAEDGPAVL